MNLPLRTVLSAGLLFLAAGSLSAQDTRVRVTVENLAPSQATFETPFWIGFHDGTFDLYDLGAPANGPGAPLPNDALERLAEDGNAEVIAQELLASGAGTIEAVLPGPSGPLAPGETAAGSFLLDSRSLQSRYFSYAAMIVPSNDAFVANGNPMAIPIFDANGDFVAPRFFDTGADILDAGTEVNDELPPNTAFFGQEMPDTGVDENGVVHDHPGFLPRGSGGILDSPRFSEADFEAAGYPALKIRFTHAPAITEFRAHSVLLSGRNEVPPVETPAVGIGLVTLVDGGTRIQYAMRLFDLRNVVMAHFHLGEPGENGPVVASLIEPREPGGGLFQQIFSEIDADDLTGPLTAQPLDALAARIEAGEIYVNIHTDDGQGSQNTGPGDFASGELRGQVVLLR